MVLMLIFSNNNIINNIIRSLKLECGDHVCSVPGVDKGYKK